MITDRLLGPSASGRPGNLALPWSCAVYSIVNWMVSFSDVEGIQVRFNHVRCVCPFMLAATKPVAGFSYMSRHFA